MISEGFLSFAKLRKRRVVALREADKERERHKDPLRISTVGARGNSSTAMRASGSAGMAVGAFVFPVAPDISRRPIVYGFQLNGPAIRTGDALFRLIRH